MDGYLHHRHCHESKKCTEEIKFDDRTIGAIPSPTPHGHLPDDDNVEEGEILEDEVLDGEVGKQETESDAEPGEIKGHLTKISVTRNEDIRDDKFISPAINAQDDVSRNCSSFETRDGKHAQACTDGVGNGFLDPKSSKGDKWHNGELGHFKSNEKLKGDFDDETLEANVYNSMGSTAEVDESKLTSSKVEPDDLEEDTLQLPEQEEEDLNRIKEESRRRRETIMEKYKKQHQQVEAVVRNEGKGGALNEHAIDNPEEIASMVDE
ncbi:hypothetical protein glysoja_041229 [Glycine soja]|uniref:Uncharacterized protein n=1 Tax=Glycine soja TaxID=3848 RepID=A0A0B2P7T2_GLYSO|nr:hypothetical protein glysoja_041229 [Glycine soja]